MPSVNRDIAKILGRTEVANTTNNALLNTASSIDAGLDSAQVLAIAGGVTVYATPNLLPISGLTAGDQAFVTSNKGLYIAADSASWYNVGLTNNAPTITDDGLDVNLVTGGNPVLVTLNATDPEGLPVTWSHAVTSGSLGGTAINQSNNIFTFTPSNNPADEGSFDVTFTASDGINNVTLVKTFILANELPVISSYTANYTLAQDGTPTVITLNATDPEGGVIVWSFAITSGTIGGTTISQAGNEFTITPSTNQADAGDFTITFTASDGIKDTDAPIEFTLAFVQEFNIQTKPAQISADYISSMTYNRTGTTALAYVQANFGTSNGAMHLLTAGATLGSWNYERRIYVDNNASLAENGSYSNASGYSLMWYAPFSTADADTQYCISDDGTRFALPNAYRQGQSGINNGGLIDIYKKTGSTWAIETTFLPSDNSYAYRGMGFRGLSMSAAGDVVAFANLPGVSAAAYTENIEIRQRSGTAWTQHQIIPSCNSIVSGNFWVQCKISANGLMLLGCHSTSQSRNVVPTIFVYERSSIADQFSLVYYYSTPSSWNGNGYGGGVNLSTKFANGYPGSGGGTAISGDGNTIAICEREADTPVGNRLGKLHIFRKSGTWSKVKEIYIASPGPSGGSSWPIACLLNYDGTKVAAMDWLADDPLNNSGAIYIYENTGAATNWNFVKRINGTEANMSAGQAYAVWPSGAAWEDSFFVSAGLSYIGARIDI
jgi:hypothetical protein